MYDYGWWGSNGKEKMLLNSFESISQARDEGSTYIQDVWVCVCVCALYTHTHITCIKVIEEEEWFSADSPLARSAPYSYSAGSKRKRNKRVRKWGNQKKKEEEKNRRVFPRHPGVMMLTHIFFLQTAPLWEYQVGLCLCRSQLRYSIDHQLFLRWATNPPFLPLLAIFSCID